MIFISSVYDSSLKKGKKRERTIKKVIECNSAKIQFGCKTAFVFEGRNYAKYPIIEYICWLEKYGYFACMHISNILFTYLKSTAKLFKFILNFLTYTNYIQYLYIVHIFIFNLFKVTKDQSHNFLELGVENLVLVKSSV